MLGLIWEGGVKGACPLISSTDIAAWDVLPSTATPTSSCCYWLSRVYPEPGPLCCTAAKYCIILPALFTKCGEGEGEYGAGFPNEPRILRSAVTPGLISKGNINEPGRWGRPSPQVLGTSHPTPPPQLSTPELFPFPSFFGPKYENMTFKECRPLFSRFAF